MYNIYVCMYACICTGFLCSSQAAQTPQQQDDVCC